MRRRFLFVPVIAAALAAPSLVAASAGSSPVAAKHSAMTSTSLKTGKASPIAEPDGRRWN